VLHGLPHWSYIAHLISNPLSTQKEGSLRGLGPACGKDGRENFPAILLILLNPLHSQKSSVGQCAVMLQNDLSLPWTNSTLKLLECLKVTSSMDVSCCGKNLAYMHPSASQETGPMVLRAKGITAVFFF